MSGVKAFDHAVAEFFMRLALDEARKGQGHTHPNPTVGAVLVRGGRVVGRGYTQPPGGPHAEVMALRAAGAKARGADLFTTLEPCSHFGRTPPCTAALIEAGIRRVVFAGVDPNPIVNGRGLKQLRGAGIAVEGPVLADEATALNRPFFKAMREGLPFVTLKLAATLDGQAATRSGDSRWISSEASRREVHRLRAQVDAVLIGAGTARADDPQLTARSPKGRDPIRVVLDPRATLSPRARLLRQRSAAPTIVVTSASGARLKALERAGAWIWPTPAKNGRLPLRSVLRRLLETGVLHVLVEGGPTVAGSVLADGLADEVWLYLGAKLAGDQGRAWSGTLGVKAMAQARPMDVVEVSRPGGDLKLVLRPR